MNWLRIPIVIGLLVVLSLLPLALSQYFLGIVTQMMIYAIFAMSLDILMGYTGLTSLGHAAYFGVGGYTVGLLSLKVTQQFGFVVAFGLGAAFAASAIFGIMALRAYGAYFLMITLSLAQVLWGVAFKWVSLTGGHDGLPGVPRPLLGIPFSLRDTTHFYFFILIICAIVTTLLYLFVHSHFGLALKGISESETRMETLGYNVWLYKYIAFIVSGVFAGLAGMLFTYYNGFVSPTDLSLVLSAKVLLMVILGGAGTLFGPALGAGVIVLLENLISARTGRWILILGVIYVTVAMFAPHGIVGTLKAKLRKSIPP